MQHGSVPPVLLAPYHCEHQRWRVNAGDLCGWRQAGRHRHCHGRGGIMVMERSFGKSVAHWIADTIASRIVRACAQASRRGIISIWRGVSTKTTAARCSRTSRPHAPHNGQTGADASKGVQHGWPREMDFVDGRELGFALATFAGTGPICRRGGRGAWSTRAAFGRSVPWSGGRRRHAHGDRGRRSRDRRARLLRRHVQGRRRGRGVSRQRAARGSAIAQRQRRSRTGRNDQRTLSGRQGPHRGAK